MMRPDYQAELLLSFNKERAATARARAAAAAAVPATSRFGARVLSISGAVLITIGSRLVRLSESQTGGPKVDATQEVVWQ